MHLSGKKVLVTGADGFIGSHLVEALLVRDCQVRAFVFYNSFNNWGWLDTLQHDALRRIEVVASDIRDTYGVRTAMQDIDVVFHLAALIAIPYSYHSPASYVETNVGGTLNVLQAALDLSVERVLVTSTSEVYGTAKYAPIDEAHPHQAQSPYSATKIAADRLAESFYRSFALPVVTVRPFNTYGPRQSARAVIPTIITQLLDGATTIKLGRLDPTRDFNYVRDTISGFLALSECDAAVGQEVNIATQTETSIGDMANLLIDALNKDARVVVDDERLRPSNSEVERLLGDNTKIRRLTNWKPEHPLDEGLDETIDWFRNADVLSRYKSTLYNE